MTTESGWHPDTVDDREVFVELLKDEVDALRAELVRLRELRPEPAGDRRFHAALREIAALHDAKQADYGKDRDPFANVRASEDFGIPGWVGCVVRANDKMRRLQQAALGRTLRNESVEDSLLDLATYALIGLVLFREASGQDFGDGGVGEVGGVGDVA